MDKGCWKHIRELLNENRLAKLDKLDAAILNGSASKEYVEKALTEYGRALILITQFADLEDECINHTTK